MTVKVIPTPLSPLDEKRFGIRSARGIIASQEDIFTVLGYCREQGVKFLIVRCDTGEIAIAQELERQGFLLMDALVYYRRMLENLPPLPTDLTMDYAAPGDEEEIKQVAARAFQNYKNHYHSDPRLDPARCDEIYVDWAVRSCRKEGADEIILVKAENRILGFLTVRLNSPQEVEGPLFAVSPEAQSRGVGRALMIGAFHWAKKQGASSFVTSTQIINLVSQALWIRLGLEPDHAFYTFHKWFD